MNVAVTNFFILMTVGIILRYQFYPNGALWGYAIMIMSLAGIVLQSTILKGLEENKESSGLFESISVFVKSIVGSQFASFLLLSSLLWIYSIYLKNETIIKTGKTPPQFDQFSGLSLALISIQVMLLYMSMSQPTKILGTIPIPKAVVNAMNSSLNSTMSLVTIINWFVIGIMYVIMEYFRTDG